MFVFNGSNLNLIILLTYSLVGLNLCNPSGKRTTNIFSNNLNLIGNPNVSNSITHNNRNNNYNNNNNSINNKNNNYNNKNNTKILSDAVSKEICEKANAHEKKTLNETEKYQDGKQNKDDEQFEVNYIEEYGGHDEDEFSRSYHNKGSKGFDDSEMFDKADGGDYLLKNGDDISNIKSHKAAISIDSGKIYKVQSQKFDNFNEQMNKANEPNKRYTRFKLPIQEYFNNENIQQSNNDRNNKNNRNTNENLQKNGIVQQNSDISLKKISKNITKNDSKILSDLMKNHRHALGRKPKNEIKDATNAETNIKMFKQKSKTKPLQANISGGFESFILHEDSNNNGSNDEEKSEGNNYKNRAGGQGSILKYYPLKKNFAKIKYKGKRRNKRVNRIQEPESDNEQSTDENKEENDNLIYDDEEAHDISEPTEKNNETALKSFKNNKSEKLIKKENNAKVDNESNKESNADYDYDYPTSDAEDIQPQVIETRTKKIPVSPIVANRNNRNNRKYRKRINKRYRYKNVQKENEKPKKYVKIRKHSKELTETNSKIRTRKAHPQTKKKLNPDRIAKNSEIIKDKVNQSDSIELKQNKVLENHASNRKKSPPIRKQYLQRNNRENIENRVNSVSNSNRNLLRNKNKKEKPNTFENKQTKSTKKIPKQIAKITRRRKPLLPILYDYEDSEETQSQSNRNEKDYEDYDEIQLQNQIKNRRKKCKDNIEDNDIVYDDEDVDDDENDYDYDYDNDNSEDANKKNGKDYEDNSEHPQIRNGTKIFIDDYENDENEVEDYDDDYDNKEKQISQPKLKNTENDAKKLKNDVIEYYDENEAVDNESNENKCQDCQNADYEDDDENSSEENDSE